MTPKSRAKNLRKPAEDARLLAEAEARFRSGDLAGAEQLLQPLAARYPKRADLQEARGTIALKQGRHRDAAALFRQAVAGQPRAAGLWNNLSLALQGAHDLEGALAAAEKAAALAPEIAEFQVNLGNRLRALGRGEAAVAAYRRALEAKSNLLAAHLGLGNTLAALGEADAAIATFQAALAGQPESARAFYHLALASKAGRATLDAETRARFAARAASGSLPVADRVLVESALGFIADLAGDSEPAFAHFAAANAAARAQRQAEGRGHDRAGHSRRVDRIIAAHPRAEGPAAGASDSARPLFVVGMPRSGTTLVEQILGRHPAVAAGGELPDLARLVDSIAGYPEGLDRLDRQALGVLADDYLATLNRIDRTAERITDKMPQNFLHIGLIARLFPQAAIVHCRRDPLDTGLSCFFQNFTQGNSFANDLADIGAYYRDYHRLMAHWRSTMAITLLELDYEALVADPEDQVRRLLAALSLPWEADCLAPGQAAGLVQTASQWQVRQAIYGRARGRAERYRRHLGPLLSALGDLAG